MERVMIFIDSNNFETAVTDLYGEQKSVDYEKLASHIAETIGGTMQRFYYYIAQGDSKQDERKHKNNQRFIDTMKNKRRAIVRTGKLDFRGKDQEGNPIYVEKGVDVYIAIDMLTLSFHNAYDNAVLMSADTDYIPVIQQIRQMGKNVTLCVPKGQKSARIEKACDEKITLSKDDLRPLLR